jgi:IMP dehydrogenase
MARVIEEGFTFDDVLIVPGESSIEPREAKLKTALARDFFINIPLISAAMDTVSDARMAIALGRLGGLGVLHRNCTLPQQVAMAHAVQKAGVPFGAACGPFDWERALALERAGAGVIVIDCAHGHNTKVLASARAIKKKLRKAKMIVGNIATAGAARDACVFADAVKVGVGPGSICTTRVVSGVGVPQLSAIMAVAKVARLKGVPVIADGGMRTSGDIAKALAAGASAVMLGNLFAGTDEAPGRVVVRKGRKFKQYRGMGSAAVLRESQSADRYLIAGRKPVAEGVAGLVAHRGPLAENIAELLSGLQVAMGYVGARSIAAFQKRARFVRITPASYAESKPHSLSEFTS